MDYNALHWWMWGDGQHCIMICNLTILQDEMWRWIMMQYIGGCGEMDNIVLQSATSPSCKMRCGDGLQLVDVRRWTTLYYNPQPFCKMRCGEKDHIIYTMNEDRIGQDWKGMLISILHSI